MPSKVQRLRDLVLLVVSSASMMLTVVFVLGAVWLRPLFVSAFGAKPEVLALISGLVSLAAGVAYVLAPPTGDRT